MVLQACNTLCFIDKWQKHVFFLRNFKFKISDMNDFEKLVFVDGEY